MNVNSFVKVLKGGTFNLKR